MKTLNALLLCGFISSTIITAPLNLSAKQQSGAAAAMIVPGILYFGTELYKAGSLHNTLMNGGKYLNSNLAKETYEKTGRMGTGLDKNCAEERSKGWKRRLLCTAAVLGIVYTKPYDKLNSGIACIVIPSLFAHKISRIRSAGAKDLNRFATEMTTIKNSKTDWDQASINDFEKVMGWQAKYNPAKK